MSSQGVAAKWTCPNDRELMLRSRLSDGRGWCTRSTTLSVRSFSAPDISAEEMAIIVSKLELAQEFDRVEVNRITMMLSKLERIRKGPTIQTAAYMCSLCGSAFNIFSKFQLKRCSGCRRQVCRSCGYTAEMQLPASAPATPTTPVPPSPAKRPATAPPADLPPATSAEGPESPRSSLTLAIRDSLQKGEKPETAVAREVPVEERMPEIKQWICMYCSESQEVWKRSNAWFQGGLSSGLLIQASAALEEVAAYSRSNISDIRRSTVNQNGIGAGDLTRLRAMAGLSDNENFDEEEDDDDADIPSDEEQLMLQRARNNARASHSKANSMTVPPATSRSRTAHLGDDGILGGVDAGDIRERSKAFSSVAEDAAPPLRKKKVRLSGRRRRPNYQAELMNGSDDAPSGNNCSTNSSPVAERKKKQTKPQMFKRTGKGVMVATRVHNDGSSSDEDPVDRPVEMDIDALVNEVKTKNKIARSGSAGDMRNPFSAKAAAAAVAAAAVGESELGIICFSVSYDLEESRLTVDVTQCLDLKAMDQNGFSDPFVILQLLSKGRCAQEKRTTIVKRSLNPVFKERFNFDAVSEAKLAGITLRLQVYDHDRISSNDFIGEVSVKLVNIHPNTVEHMRMELLPKDEELTRLESLSPDSAPYGKLLLTLNYLSLEQVLIVKIVRATDLPPMDTNGLADPYVKCYLHPDPNKNTKQKTKTISKTLDPEFDEEFRYPVKRADLRGKTLAVTVWDYDWNSANDFIGSVYFSESETGVPYRHFMDCINIPNCAHTVWHTLQFERRPL